MASEPKADTFHCEGCGEPINKGDLVYDCIDGGWLHASCMGWPDETDADGFFDVETGEPCDERPEPTVFQ